MKLLPFFLVNLAAFALLQFAWIPSVERRMHIDSSMASISRAASLSLLGFGRSVFLVGTLTTAALIITILIVQLFGGATAAEVTSSIETIHRVRVLLSGFGPMWGAIVLVLLILALALFARRRGRLRMEKTFRELYEKRFAQLRSDLELGKLKELPPTAEMLKVVEKIGEAERLLAGWHLQGFANHPDAATAKEEIINQIDMLHKYYFALDVQRRVDMHLDPEDVALPEARTKWEKVQTFFISRGLLASLGRTSRVLYFASLLLLVPSLTGVYSISTTAAVDDRLVQLKDLRVELTRKQYDQSKAQLGEPENKLTEEDKEDLQEVARAYEQMSAPSIFPVAMRSHVFTMRSTLVRQEVLAHAATRANNVRQQYESSAVWEQQSSGSKVTDLDAVERQIVTTPEEAMRSRGPVTPQGKRVYTELEDIARRSPSFMERIRTGLRSFQRPATSYDITYALFNQMASTLAGEAPGPFGDIFRGVGLDASRNPFKGFTEMQSREFLFDLTQGTTLPDALNRVAASDSQNAFVGPREKIEFHTIMRTAAEDLPVDKINRKLADYPPSVDVAPEKHVDMHRAVDVANRFKVFVASANPMRSTDTLADSLASFSDWFPAQLGADSRTRRGELLANWGAESRPLPVGDGPTSGTDPYSGAGSGSGSGGGGGGGSGGGGGGGSGASGSGSASSHVRNTASRSSFLRARSFGGLRGFSRVGGVLIGQTPMDATTAKQNFVDLQWEINGPTVRFTLVKSDGQRIQSQPYRISIAYHALNYSADGRPLAVTMANADPLKELKILLHPTLIDTALGHRVIEIDRFVDMYTGESEAREKAERQVYAHHALYSFVWANRALGLMNVLSEGKPDDSLARFQESLESHVSKLEDSELIAEALADPSAVGDPQKSPLSIKKEFYDQGLVEIIKKLQPGTTAQTLGSTTQSTARQEFRSALLSRDEEKLKAYYLRWMSEPPQFEVWSGVREKDFDSSVSHIFRADGTDLSMPFDFMLQVAFTSTPSFGSDADAEGYSDTQPWEFPLLRDMIQDKVIESVKNDQTGRSQTIVADVSEFTMLQRLFRMAFNGHLGDDFPVEKMLELSDVLAVKAPVTLSRTLRWNARMGMATLLSTAKSEEFSFMRELREALGVAQDDKQLRSDRGALPPLE